jgi:hypothetical protein
VAIHKSAQAREIRIPLSDTPARDAQGATPLFGDAKATIAGKELRIEMPGESLTIFAAN